MAEKYIELNLNDEKSGLVAEILGNKTCKKILGLLAEEELSQGDIAKRLEIGLSNVDYNINKLVDSGLVEKSKAFFWSVKGKKIPTYRLANKKIIISTKTSFNGLLASSLTGAFVLGALKLGINFYNSQLMLKNIYSQNLAYEAAPAFASGVSKATGVVQGTSLWSNVLIWALIGLAIGGLGFLLYKKFKNFVKGGRKIKI